MQKCLGGERIERIDNDEWRCGQDWEVGEGEGEGFEIIGT